jgi:hypothetical protein
VISVLLSTLLLAFVMIAQESPSPPPTPIPSPAPSPSASPVPQPSQFGYVVGVPSPAPGAPGILEVAVSARQLHAGGPWLMRVTTTPEITGVAVEAMGMHIALFPAGTGVFSAMGTIPNAPSGFLDRDYALNVVGTTADGRRATCTVTLRLVR